MTEQVHQKKEIHFNKTWLVIVSLKKCIIAFFDHPSPHYFSKHSLLLVSEKLLDNTNEDFFLYMATQAYHII